MVRVSDQKMAIRRQPDLFEGITQGPRFPVVSEATPVRSATLPLVFLFSLGCASTGHTGDPPPLEDFHDRKYLNFRLQDEGCGTWELRYCCSTLRTRLDEAISTDRMASVATALDALALACPDMRDIALAALEHRPAASADVAAGMVEVAYSAQIGSGDRVYWASAFLDGKQVAGAAVSAGLHVLDVEMHVMSVADTSTDTLFRVRGRKVFPLEPRATRTILAVLRRNDRGAAQPFSFDLVEKQPIPPSTDPEAPSAPLGQVGMQPSIVGGGLKTLSTPRFPSELQRDSGWSSDWQVCLDSSGRPQSVMPLGYPPHPRLLGVLFDSLAHAEFVPLSRDGRRIPGCYTQRISVVPR